MSKRKTPKDIKISISLLATSAAIPLLNGIFPSVNQYAVIALGLLFGLIAYFSFTGR